MTALFSIQAVMPVMWFMFVRAVIVRHGLRSVMLRDELRDVHDVP